MFKRVGEILVEVMDEVSRTGLCAVGCEGKQKQQHGHLGKWSLIGENGSLIHKEVAKYKND